MTQPVLGMTLTGNMSLMSYHQFKDKEVCITASDAKEKNGVVYHMKTRKIEIIRVDPCA